MIPTRTSLQSRLRILLSAAACALLAAGSVDPVSAGSPNIVVIFTDDQGYGDVGVYGATGFETPHLDRMAKEGVRFSDWYVSQAVCSASRAALLTGCYNVRVGIMGALGPGSKIGINAGETTLAEVCKARGYATAIYGKWHLGDRKPFLPTRHGFDDYFGLPYSNDMWPFHPTAKHFPDLPLFEKEAVINPRVTGKDQEQLTTQYTERAVKFIKANKENPFFLYVPHSMPHVPLFVSAKFKGKSKQGLYGDVMMEIDWSVGEILKALKESGVDDHTLVIFTTDNGPWLSYGDHAGTTGPLREGKGTMWDGGCRTPCIMRWPAKIPAGTVCRELASTIDILPTVAKLIGAELPEHKIDGKDIWPLMSGKPGAQSPHEVFWGYYGRQLQFVRSGKWKLHFPHGYRTLAGRKGGTGGKPVPYEQTRTGLALYNLESDISEKTNLVKKHPEVVARLQALGEKAREALGDGKRQGGEIRPPGKVE